MHADDPPARLLAAMGEAVDDWLRRLVIEAARRGGVPTDRRADEIDRMVAAEAPRLMGQLADLLGCDVEAQTTTPLALLRAATGGPSRLLAAWGVPVPPADRFESSMLANDPYRLGPANWADVDERLHEPGLAWGAWKAITVMRRHAERSGDPDDDQR